MKKEITLGQLIAVGMAVLIPFFAAWIRVNTQLSSHDTQIKNLQTVIVKYEDANQRIEQKIDKIFDIITDVKVDLKNKKDRE